MYDGWIDHVWEHARHLNRPSVTDVACSDGYFLYRLLEKGAGSAVGYDRDEKRGAAIDLLNRITGMTVQFRPGYYNSQHHTVANAVPADIVIASAIMVHVSDPLHFFACLASLTRHVLFLFTHLDDAPDLRITFRGKLRKYYDDPFPNCFNADTRVSRPLFEVAARELGFKQIVSIMHRPEWMPLEWYRRQNVMVLLK